MEVTQLTAQAIEKISGSISQIDERTEEMKKDIAEQLAALTEIAKNTDESAQGANEVASNVTSMRSKSTAAG